MTGMQILPTGISRLLTGALSKPEELSGKRLLAFSGIGSPEAFGRTVTRFLGEPVRHEAFSDHHRYTPEDLKLLEHVARETGAEVLVTTQKDSVRLKPVPGFAHLDGRFPVYVVHVGAVLAEGDSLVNRIMESL
jgi:tetraacyldisaccharide 4'-kinase